MKNLSPIAVEFMKLMGINYPIIQAGMDGAATPPLVAAVSNAGGLGTLPLGFRSPLTAHQQILEVKQTTDAPFLTNFVLNFPTLSLATAIQAGVKSVLFSWGMPDKHLLKQVRDHKLIMGIQVSDAGSARRALELKPDFLVCQGIEAGGHVQGNMALIEALQEVLQVSQATPVVASGGIATGADIYRYLQAGAAAVVMGTRFIATEESAAHDLYKQEILQAQSAADTVLTVCLNKIWPNATHRLLRSNLTFQQWESEGRPTGPTYIPGGALVGNRPGEHDIIALDSDGNTTWERYVDVVPVQSMLQCDVNSLGTFAGEGVGAITDIPTVGNLMQRLIEEYNKCCELMADISSQIN
jgi:nitronate monooxygenase